MTQFLTRADSSVVADDWDVSTRIRPEFLGQNNPEFVETVITITVANGRAQFKVIGWDPVLQALRCERLPGAVLNGEPWPPPYRNPPE